MEETNEQQYSKGGRCALTKTIKKLHTEWMEIISDEPKRTGWVHTYDGIWWYGNGDIVPFNWSKRLNESCEMAKQTKQPLQPKQPVQLMMFED